MKNMYNFLSKYCSEEWCQFVEFFSSKTTFKTNEYIFKSGEDTLGLHILEKGKVKITTNAGQNQERIIRLASDGDILGHRGFGGDWKYTISAITLEETSVYFIPLKILNQTIKANPEFGFYMMMFFAEELRESERLASQLPIRNLVASVIATNFHAFGWADGSLEKLSYSLSRKDIASFAGTRYETVVRILADLQKENVLKLVGKEIHILDLEKLELIKNMLD